MTTKNLPKHIVFDFGGVLLDIDLKLTVDAFEALDINVPDPSNIHPNNDGIFLALEKGLISDEDFFDTLQSYSTGSPKPELSQIQAAWNALLHPFKWEHFDLLDTLAQRGHSVHLLSNTNQPHHLFFEKRFNDAHPQGRNFRSFFDKVFYSDELKMRKPDREIYQFVESSLGSKEILFIDDNAPNLVEPQNLGWQTLHKDPKKSIISYFY